MRTAWALSLIFASLFARPQALYFPPTGAEDWETTDPADLGWCQDRIDS